MQTVPSWAGGAVPWPFFCALRSRAGLFLALLVGAMFSVGARTAAADSIPDLRSKVVHASYYGREFAWRLTASGERYDPSKLSAAHRTLPLGTRLRVTNLHNGRSVLVTINDRGPYVSPRELDLSLGAARILGMIRRGIARVRIERVES
jgi:rare lipoprotein A (peptidoglycan hydrolase)